MKAHEDGPRVMRGLALGLSAFAVILAGCVGSAGPGAESADPAGGSNGGEALPRQEPVAVGGTVDYAVATPPVGPVPWVQAWSGAVGRDFVVADSVSRIDIVFTWSSVVPSQLDFVLVSPSEKQFEFPAPSPASENRIEATFEDVDEPGTWMAAVRARGAAADVDWAADLVLVHGRA